MKIYTKKGDNGETSLLGGTRVSKAHLRIEAYGTLDELNAWMGMLSDQAPALEFVSQIRAIQNNLFTIGSILANDPEKSVFKLPEIAEADVILLEKSMDKMEEMLPPLKNFVLPGGHSSNSMAHVARTVCRRAERRVVELHAHSPVNPLIISYLNRLSDWLFVLSRFFSSSTQSPEITWNG
ncbi:MAG: cob(I)yrinic acid a,c-diamide adenosyltransferase [Bacteroidia bacterium]|nr:cob(I)yrinic acid a,c-diamide adenosyltransferase [Bacteroidia bacterium]